MAKEKRGILLLALGHRNYLNMASTLALSLRANGYTGALCLATDDVNLFNIQSEYKAFFTDLVTVPERMFTNKKQRCYLKAKAHIYDLTPYEETLFLDVDLIALNERNVSEFLDGLSGLDFCIKNSGGRKANTIQEGEQQWADLSEVVRAYEFNEEVIWDVHSEVIWFKKTPENAALFKRWKYNFENLKTKHRVFATCIPDELPLYIAMSQENRGPGLENWKPTYWPSEQPGQLALRDLRGKDYLFLSIGGSNVAKFQLTNYNLLVEIYAKPFGLRYTYKAQQKRRWLAERQTI